MYSTVFLFHWCPRLCSWQFIAFQETAHFSGIELLRNLGLALRKKGTAWARENGDVLRAVFTMMSLTAFVRKWISDYMVVTGH